MKLYIILSFWTIVRKFNLNIYWDSCPMCYSFIAIFFVYTFAGLHGIVPAVLLHALGLVWLSSGVLLFQGGQVWRHLVADQQNCRMQTGSGCSQSGGSLPPVDARCSPAPPPRPSLRPPASHCIQPISRGGPVRKVSRAMSIRE